MKQQRATFPIFVFAFIDVFQWYTMWKRVLVFACDYMWSLWFSQFCVFLCGYAILPFSSSSLFLPWFTNFIAYCRLVSLSFELLHIFSFLRLSNFFKYFIPLSLQSLLIFPYLCLFIFVSVLSSQSILTPIQSISKYFSHIHLNKVSLVSRWKWFFDVFSLERRCWLYMYLYVCSFTDTPKMVTAADLTNDCMCSNENTQIIMKALKLFAHLRMHSQKIIYVCCRIGCLWIDNNEQKTTTKIMVRGVIRQK